MSSRKRLHKVEFTTTAPMDIIMGIVQQLYSAGSVKNLNVEEIPITPANALETAD